MSIDNNLRALIIDNALINDLNDCLYGIEKEGVRVRAKDAKLSLNKHPITYDSEIIKDYSEAQTELVTPPLPKNEVLKYLDSLLDKLYRNLSHEEVIWPSSLPPLLPNNDNDIPISQDITAYEYGYREYLGRKYGRKTQLMSGIHLNFSLSENLFNKLFELQDRYDDLVLFKNSIYLKIANNFQIYTWFLNYILGATPVADKEYFKYLLDNKYPYKNKTTYKNAMRSIRNSHLGYLNNLDIKVDYSSLNSYVNDIKNAVKRERLAAAREFYALVRLRNSKTNNLDELIKQGVEYLEFRIFDIDPFTPRGISEETLEFLHIFILYLLLKECDAPTHIVKDKFSRFQAQSIRNAYEVAEEHPLNKTKFEAEAFSILEDMRIMLIELNFVDKLKYIDSTRLLFEQPERTIAAKVFEAVHSSSYYEFHLSLAKKYTNNFKK